MNTLRKYSLAAEIFYLLTFVSIPHDGHVLDADRVSSLDQLIQTLAF
jgi:hypothetical protein